MRKEYEQRLEELKKSAEEEVDERLDASVKRILAQNRRMAEELKIHVQVWAVGRAGAWVKYDLRHTRTLGADAGCAWGGRGLGDASRPAGEARAIRTQVERCTAAELCGRHFSGACYRSRVSDPQW